MTDEEAAKAYASGTVFVDETGNDEALIYNMRAMAFLAGVEHGRPKWISVKERMPEKDTKQEVLIAEKYDDDGDYGQRVETWYYTRWEHLAPDTNYDDHHKCEITHWMPLPKDPA